MNLLVMGTMGVAFAAAGCGSDSKKDAPAIGAKAKQAVDANGKCTQQFEADGQKLLADLDAAKNGAGDEKANLTRQREIIVAFQNDYNGARCKAADGTQIDITTASKEWLKSIDDQLAQLNGGNAPATGNGAPLPGAGGPIIGG